MPPTTPPTILESTLDVLHRLCAISSPSGDAGGLNRAASCYAEALTDRGFRVRRQDHAGLDDQHLPVLDATLGPTTDAATESSLLLVGHLDTVLPAISPQRRHDRLIATGAIDMKGGLAALLGAIDLLQAEARPIPDDLRLVVVPDEEVTGPISHAVVRQAAASARALWVLEPGRAATGPDRKDRGEIADSGETMVLSRRGLLQWSLDVHGRGAHAGNSFWQGRSALTAACDWVVRARALARPGSGPTVNAGRLVAGDQSFVDDLGERSDLLFSTRQTNVVANRARIEGEARYLTTDDGETLRSALPKLAAAIADRHEVEATFTWHGDIPSLVGSAAARAHATRAIALAAARGWHLEIEDDRGGISFPNFLVDPTVLPILDGLGPIGGGMHTREEWIDLRSLDRRIAWLADLLADAAA